MMKAKNEQAELRQECKEGGACGQYGTDGIDGPIQCSDGTVTSPVKNIQWECNLVDQLSFIPIKNIGFNPKVHSSPEMNDVWAWVDPVTQDEYAIAGLTSGTSFIRVTDPGVPQVIAHIATRTQSSLWRDMKVIGNFVYIVSEAWDHGMQVFDLTRLRDLQEPPQYLFADFNYTEVGHCHNIVANEETNYLYLVGCRSTCSGIHIVDASDPGNPQFVTCHEGDGYVHDAQCVVYHGPDSNYVGKEICFSYNEDTLTIVDVDDKTDIKMVSRTGYNGVEYTHQGWVTDDHELLLLDDELDEARDEASSHQRTYIWDIHNLAKPIMVHRYQSDVISIDHNQYILGNLTYQSNYKSGLRILYIDRVNFLLTEVAYFDSDPETGANFEGSWSVYPYLPSGNILLTSIQYGLFVLEPDYEAIFKRTDEIEASEKKKIRSRHREIIYADDIDQCPPLEESEYKIVN